MNTTLTTRITALTIAVLLTAVANGSMLLSFDTMAGNGASDSKVHTPTLVKLDTVTIIAKANA